MNDIDRIRAFSRAFTGRIGLLSRSYLGSGLGLAEVRVLHDLDAPEPVRARTLALALGIDEGQMSRIVSGFLRRGWVVRVPGADGRARPLQLTEAGRNRLADLRRSSRAQLVEALAPLGTGGCAALAAALDQAAAILDGALAPDPTQIRLRDLEPGDAGWVIARHGLHYAQDEGYDATFEALVAEILAAYLLRADPLRERGFIAEGAGGARLGSIFCMSEGPDAPDIARLRLFLVEPQARGSGLAQRMIDACMGFAQAAGYRRMRLWTHASHRAAGRLYARNGFSLTDERPGRAFGRDVTDQTWERPLTGADSRLAIDAPRR